VIWKRNSVGGSWVGYGYGCLEDLESGPGRWGREAVSWNVYQSPVITIVFGGSLIASPSISLEHVRTSAGLKTLNLGR